MMTIGLRGRIIVLRVRTRLIRSGWDCGVGVIGYVDVWLVGWLVGRSVGWLWKRTFTDDLGLQYSTSGVRDGR